MSETEKQLTDQQRVAVMAITLATQTNMPHMGPDFDPFKTVTIAQLYYGLLMDGTQMARLKEPTHVVVKDNSGLLSFPKPKVALDQSKGDQ